jgi:hypothetical protein
MRGDKRESRERLVEEDDSDGGGDDLTAIDDDAERQKRRKDKLRERDEHVVQVAQLRKEGMQVLRAAGMRQLETEGVGDCWLIALLAGHELDAGNIQHFSPEQRQALLTPWRLKLIDIAPHVDTKCFILSGEQLGIEYLKKVAMYFGVPSEVIRACEVAKDWKKTRALISRALSPWKKPKHFGKHQEPVHVCMGLILQKNILEIELPSISSSGTGMLRATLACYAAQPCPHSC